MEEKRFAEVAANESNPKWKELTQRQNELYKREEDARSPFERDYTRVLHSLAYRRLKHKTQVFFNIENDHICTRMEHVAHVESVSSTIAKCLGLNMELTKAIAIAHDLGHTPFGHHGEQVVGEIAKAELGETFWHEKNGVRFVDTVELLEDSYRVYQNLNLTYAVRDGIISHCGEMDENRLIPRKEFIDLKEFKSAGQYQAVTWEGCVVKLADKIAYIGRDIEDALCFGFFSEEVRNKLEKMAREKEQGAINTTVIMYNLIVDVCKNSSLEKGICLSEEFLGQLKELKDFNYNYIYGHKRLKPFKNYAEMIIRQIYDTLAECYDGPHTFQEIQKLEVYYVTLAQSFSKWLARYCESSIVPKGELKDLSLRCENIKMYKKLEEKNLYIQAILDYISGMTDRFAIKIFNEFLAY